MSNSYQKTALSYQLLDRNLTATGCLSMSLCVPSRKSIHDKSAVLSVPVPHCTSLSVEENDYESEGRRFESCRARYYFPCKWGIFFLRIPPAFLGVLPF